VSTKISEAAVKREPRKEERLFFCLVSLGFAQKAVAVGAMLRVWRIRGQFMLHGDKFLQGAVGSGMRQVGRHGTLGGDNQAVLVLFRARRGRHQLTWRGCDTSGGPQRSGEEEKAGLWCPPWVCLHHHAILIFFLLIRHSVAANYHVLTARHTLHLQPGLSSH